MNNNIITICLTVGYSNLKNHKLLNEDLVDSIVNTANNIRKWDRDEISLRKTLKDKVVDTYKQATYKYYKNDNKSEEEKKEEKKPYYLRQQQQNQG